MADHSLTDLDPPRRRRRGPPPRLYVIARQSPVPWLRVRRLGEADRPALRAHLVGLSAGEGRARSGPEEAAIAAACTAVDFRAAILFGAMAGNALIAAACGIPAEGGPEVAATEDARYRGRGLGEMLVQQVLGALPAAGPGGDGGAGAALLALMRALRDAEPRHPGAEAASA